RKLPPQLENPCYIKDMSVLESAKKIAIIRYRGDDTRTAHTVSNENLVKAYQKVFKGKKVETFFVSNEYADPENSLKKLKDFHPDTIILLDQRIMISTFFKMTKLFEMNFLDTNFIIHVYGDFISRMTEWKKLLEIYPELNLEISVASQAQKKIVEAMLKTPIAISIIPYPVEDIDLDELEGD